MSISPPFLVSSIQDRIPVELAALYQRSQTHLTDTDKKAAVALLTDAYCDLIDSGCVYLLDDINHSHSSKELREALYVIQEIKNKTRHYLGWLSGFIANDRLIPVIEHFYALMYHMDIGSGVQPYIAFNISAEPMADIRRVLSTLKDGSAANLDEVVELLIVVIEEAVEPLMLRPKDLMHFSYIVDKTLNGVIALALGQFKRSLRKLAGQLPREVYPLLSTHFESFLIV